MITPAQLKIFWKQIDEGSSIAHAARMADFSRKSGDNVIRDQRGRHLVKPPSGASPKHHYSQRSGPLKDPRMQGMEEGDLPEPVAPADLSSEAARALEDFHYFSTRYFGRVPVPWRKEAADRVLKLYESDEKEFAVINCPPGVGKTTLFTHDISAWLTMRDRNIRGVLGSWGMTTAGTYTNRLRTTFERTALAPVSDEDVRKGIELEPGGILAVDYGRIKPMDSSAPWTANVFEVVPSDGRRSANKEPTWAAFGAGEIVGWRVRYMCFDDLVTVRKLESEAEQNRMRLWWDSEVEKRLEPGGLLLLEGQRLGANDHYRYCLDKVDIDEDDIELIDLDETGVERRGKKYHSIIFPAHFDEDCPGGGSKEEHHDPKTAKPWPEGCLLDPKRLRYRDLMRERLENPSRYETVFQQNDTNPDTVLVPAAWIKGDGDGLPGCWDEDRDAWELPELTGAVHTIVSVDPSPTKNWAVQAWAYHPDSESYFLLDLFRGAMTLPEFLYGENNTYSGKLEEFRKNFEAMGRPLRHVIFEKNVAQRWFTQMPYKAAWERKYQIRVLDHETTHKNKTDPKYGVTMLRPLFKHGNIRLPGRQTRAGEDPKMFSGRRNAIKLTNELTVYSLEHGPGGTDDQIMSCWMMANKAHQLKAVSPDRFPKLNAHLPGWAKRVA